MRLDAPCASVCVVAFEVYVQNDRLWWETLQYNVCITYVESIITYVSCKRVRSARMRSLGPPRDEVRLCDITYVNSSFVRLQFTFEQMCDLAHI